MSKGNLPLALLERHREALGLTDPVVFEHENDLFVERSGPIESAVVFLPKSKPLIDMTLALVSDKVVPEGKIVLVGANDAGIRSANTAYEKNVGPVTEKIVGNHSAMYVGLNKKLGAGKTWRDFLSFVPLSYVSGAADASPIAIEVAKIPGVFNQGALDEGTKLLLDHIPYDKRSVVDVGCGAGVIGTIYKKKNPTADVTMVDSSHIAVNATEETLAKNSIAAHVALSDVFSNVAGKFDLIVANPPFHKGVDTDYSFIERFARDAGAHLNKGGEVIIVANSFLPYQDILGRNIGPTEVVIDTKKFRIYRSKQRLGL